MSSPSAAQPMSIGRLLNGPPPSYPQPTRPYDYERHQQHSQQPQNVRYSERTPNWSGSPQLEHRVHTPSSSVGGYSLGRAEWPEEPSPPRAGPSSYSDYWSVPAPPRVNSHPEPVALPSYTHSPPRAMVSSPMHTEEWATTVSLPPIRSPPALHPTGAYARRHAPLPPLPQRSHYREEPSFERNKYAFQGSARASVRLVSSATKETYSPPTSDYSRDTEASDRGSSVHSQEQRRRRRGASEIERKLSAKPRDKPASGSISDQPPFASLDRIPNNVYTLAPRPGTDREDGRYEVVRARITEATNLAREPQTSRCMSSRYKNDNFPKCVSCTRRWQGDTCRFQNIRSFFRDSRGRQEDSTQTVMEYPLKWNTHLEKAHIDETKKICANALLPTLREELEHIKREEVIYRPRENEVRATCDTCLTSIFCCSWMCRICGREACSDCFEQIKGLTIELPEGAPKIEVEAQRARVEKQLHNNAGFLQRRSPTWRSFYSRRGRLSMARLLLDPPRRRQETPRPLRSLRIPRRCWSAPPDFSPVASSSALPEIPSHDILRFKVQPLLVTGVGEKLKIKWTPEYFMEEYGSQDCLIIECQTEANRRVTVADFFSSFGRYTGRDESWKLKDWPPSSDFKTDFPELYADFSQAVPIPNYVRRDGALNFASHFPTNTIGPDLGPKMYNANANLEDVDTKGSTRLHMDMADALNLMAYAAPRPDGQEGCAAWDLFRAEDSGTLRRFLHSEYAIAGLDPIHSQQVYLNDEKRRQLWEQHGVKSFRVYQKAGEAVFIPAGCAHQVRNLSDCIKVAIDFVSPENIERCEKLTKEFREVNQLKAWKEDVLQLRTMMWFAWLSCCQQEEKRAAAAASV
ncbi:hypothetical protein C8R46DRAFT_1074100 [Mycena filopes]|nr:hypothetical protein C8R46DRAFT_1074100 [Mycena filopes]